MAIEIVNLPIENGGSFHSYVKVYQRVPLMTAFGQVAAAAEASSCCFLAKITGMYKYQTHELFSGKTMANLDTPFRKSTVFLWSFS